MKAIVTGSTTRGKVKTKNALKNFRHDGGHSFGAPPTKEKKKTKRRSTAVQVERVNLEVEHDGEDNGIRFTRTQKCRVLCGFESILVVVLTLSLCGGQVYILSFVFYNWSFSWIFLVLFFLAFSEAIWFAKQISNLVSRKDTVENTPDDKKNEENGRKIYRALRPMIKTYNDWCDVNGKYYLVKMYTSEVVEHTNLILCMTRIYLCKMPVEMSVIVLAVLTMELIVNLWATFHMHTQEVRDRLILLDIFVEVFCLAFPLLYTWLSFYFEVAVEELTLLTVYPTISLLLKLHDVWEEYLNINLQRIKAENVRGKRMSRKRNSILKFSINRSTFQTQLDHFPNWARYSFSFINACFLLFFGGLIGVHLATKPSNEKCNGVLTSQIWEQCRLPVPFCQNPFVPNCDCAWVRLLNYTEQSLPGSFGRMASLVRLEIVIGELEYLPGSFGKDHKILSEVIVIGNRLKYLPQSIGELEKLWLLRVSNNQLTSLPESIGNLRSSVNGKGVVLDISHNQLKSLPESIGHGNIGFLYGNFNRLASLPESIGQLENLLILQVQNNQLSSLPESIGKLDKMRVLLAWSNNLTTLPYSVGNLKSLQFVDFRHNNITKLPPTINKWNNIEYFYTAGNKVCNDVDLPSNFDKAKGLCKEQCSVDCPSVWRGDGYCGDNIQLFFYVKTYDIPLDIKPKPSSGCNTKSCNYDDGDCPAH
jgi:hypothetical protein